MVVSATVAQLMMTRAYQLAPAAQVGPFIYSSVAFAALFDWLLFARQLDLLTCLGTPLIVTAGILALRVGHGSRAAPVVDS
jgi:drug/metabolite transporter (DMT)-like permease